MDNEPTLDVTKTTKDNIFSKAKQMKSIFILSALAVTAVIVILVGFHLLNMKSTDKESLYTLIESWDIPGGQGRSIVIKPEKVSEQDLFTLGELLKQESTIYTNAFVYVYDDADAANLRKVVMEGNPSPEEALKHDEHFKGIFSKVGEQENVFDVFLSGSRGNNNKRMTF